MKYISTTLIFVFALSNFFILNAQNTQEYKIKMSSGKLILEDIDDLVIKGYDGNEIIIASEKEDAASSERAAGLRLINNYGMTDNTGLGISVEQEGNVITAMQISDNNDDKEIMISVPRGIDVYISHGSHDAETITVKDFTKELEITTNYHDIRFENVTGPMAIKTVYGDIEGSFTSLNQNGSISIYAVYSHVDVTIPQSAKANLTLSTSYGDVYSNAQIQIEQRKLEKSENKCGNAHTGGDIIGTLNGGGVDVNLKSSYENVYLRAQ